MDKIHDRNGEVISIGDYVIWDDEKGRLTKIIATDDMEGDNPRVHVGFGGHYHTFIAHSQANWWNEPDDWRVTELVKA